MSARIAPSQCDNSKFDLTLFKSETLMKSVKNNLILSPMKVEFTADPGTDYQTAIPLPENQKRKIIIESYL
jgi:hypothetical protein